MHGLREAFCARPRASSGSSCRDDAVVFQPKSVLEGEAPLAEDPEMIDVKCVLI